jgi:hypothetical protein
MDALALQVCCTPTLDFPGVSSVQGEGGNIKQAELAL